MKNIFILIMGMGLVVFSQAEDKAKRNLTANAESLKEWQALRFGMFIHWGPVSLRGTEIGWSRGREVPFEDYDSLYKEFNPVLFNADEWAQIAKNAGMKYIILVTKHHDGFSLWDSQYTDYDIFSSPFKRDIVGELAAACKKQGLLFGTYYSILDWYHPDYPIKKSGDVPKKNPNMERYVAFLKGQVKELIEKYDSKIMWFDGEWEKPWTHEMGLDLYAYCRQLNDKVLVNNRVDKGRRGMEGNTEAGEFAGDFETPEQRIGRYNPDKPWESCITIGKQWAWKPNDELKSTRECIQMLVRTAGGGGNLLLNVAPMLDGRIEQRQIQRLKEIGNWLKRYGDTIYGTQGGPIPPQEWGVTTKKNNTVYLHVLNKTDGKIFVPELKIKSARSYKSQTTLHIEAGKKGTEIWLPEDVGSEIDFIIESDI